MNPYPAWPRTLSSLLLVLPIALSAQNVSPALAEGETVVLSPFEVSDSQPTRYQADQAASGGRIRTNVMDTPSTVTVLTSEFLEDISGGRVLDAAKYIAGVGESTIPNGLDRINIRGFQTQGRRVDGFSTNDQSNYDPALVERMEVIKGPDALLQPAGVPGGTINLVTKRPQFTSSGSLKVQIGQYDTNRIEGDITGPINDRFAYRVVAAVQDNDGFIQRSFRESYLFSPALTWRVSPTANLTLRYEYYDFVSSNISGLITDARVSTNGPFKTIEGVPLNFSPTPDKKHSFRRATTNSGTVLFTSTITDQLSVRLAGRLSETPSRDSDFRWDYATPVYTQNPFTGEWDGGVIWSNISADPANPNWVSAPAVVPDNFGHSGTRVWRGLRYRDLQNDWSYIVDTDSLKSTTLIGFAYAYEHQNSNQNRQSLPNFSLTNFQVPTVEPTSAPLNSDQRFQISRYQVYVTEQLELFEQRLILSGGVSHVTFNGLYGNKLSAASANAVAGQMYPGSGSKATYNYGVVVKPLRNLSLYYGHTENAVPATNYQQTTNGAAPIFSEGTQDEVGIKALLFDGRIIASVAYYEIAQTGYAVANPLSVTVPPPPVAIPLLILSREASGYEFQIVGNLTPNFSLIASYTDTKNRDPNGIMLRGSAEDMGAIFARYEVSRGALKGFAVGVGANTMSKRAIDQAGGFAPLSDPSAPIPTQPRGYMPARTLADVYFYYNRGPWSYQVVVTNVTDKLYYAASTGRNLINVGNPRAVSGSVSWKF